MSKRGSRQAAKKRDAKSDSQPIPVAPGQSAFDNLNADVKAEILGYLSHVHLTRLNLVSKYFATHSTWKFLRFLHLDYHNGSEQPDNLGWPDAERSDKHNTFICRKAKVEISNVDSLRLKSIAPSSGLFAAYRNLISLCGPRLRFLETPWRVPNTQVARKEVKIELDPHNIEVLDVAIGFVSVRQILRLLRSGCPKLYKLAIHDMDTTEDVVEMLRALKESALPNLLSLGFSLSRDVQRVDDSFAVEFFAAVKSHSAKLRCLHLPGPYRLSSPSFNQLVLGYGFQTDVDSSIESCKFHLGAVNPASVRFSDQQEHSESIISYAHHLPRSKQLFDEWYSSEKLVCGLDVAEEVNLRLFDLCNLAKADDGLQWTRAHRDKLQQYYGDLHHHLLFGNLCLIMAHSSNDENDVAMLLRCAEHHPRLLRSAPPDLLGRIFATEIDWVKQNLDLNNPDLWQTCRVMMNYASSIVDVVVDLMESKPNLEPERLVQMMQIFFQIRQDLSLASPALIRVLNLANARKVKYDKFITWDNLTRIFETPQDVQEAYACFIPWNHATSNINITLERLAPIKNFLRLHFKANDSLPDVPTDVLHTIAANVWTRSANTTKTEGDLDRLCAAMKDFCADLPAPAREGLQPDGKRPVGISGKSYASIISKHFAL